MAKSPRVVAVLFLACFWCGPVWADQTLPPADSTLRPSSEKRLRVLFIGNSYTYINDLPKLTARLAASASPSRKLETEFVGEGGATLQRHWEAGKALEAIRKRGWDYVILQDQGTLGHSDDFRRINDPEMFHTYARRFDAEIRKAGATTLFFLTWARQDSPQSQALLTRAYASIAGELGGVVAPAGVAWQNALKENPKLVLHDADRSHPSPTGSYLTACVFYAVLFSSSPVGLTRADLSEADAAFLQQIAWQTAKDPQLALASATEATIDVTIPKERVGAAAPTPATSEALERGRAILAAAQKGSGGLERLRGIRDVSVAYSGKIRSPMGEMALDGRETVIFPGVLRTEMKLPFGEVGSFYDGNSGWNKAARGVQELPERMKKVYRAQTIRNTFNLLRAEGEFSVQFEKREKVGERDADVILIAREGESVRLFVEAKSGTLIKKAFQGMGTGGPADFEEFYSDHREVSGITLPFRIETRQNGAPFLDATVTDVKFNSGIDPVELGKRPGS